MTWTTERPTEPGLYWWRWGQGFEAHDANYVEGAEIVRVWVQPTHADPVWWVSHFDDKATKVELKFTGGQWWPERIAPPPSG